jgi:hypothetical protein
MNPGPSSAPAIECAEDIALLYLLHSVPVPPFRNSIDDVSLPRSGYTLSLEDERNLVGTLAFLSCVEDDPSHIPAICVKENPKLSTLSVLIAVNKATWGDGKQALQTLRRGFEKIFTILSQVKEG